MGFFLYSKLSTGSLPKIMPHISVKMLGGKTAEQKALAVKKLSQAMCDAIGCTSDFVSIALEEYTPEEWQEIFATEISASKSLVQEPNYDPKSLLG